MAGVASIAWLRKGGIGVVNRKGSSSVWSWGIIFTLYWGQGKLEQLDGVAQDGIELLSLVIDHYQQNKLSECFIYLRSGNHMLFNIKTHTQKTVTRVN